jgi:cyanate permease
VVSEKRAERRYWHPASAASDGRRRGGSVHAFAEICGYLFGAFLLGAVLGPLLMGMGFDAMGSYRPMLAVLALSTLAAVGLVSRLEPYRKSKLAPA